MRKISEMIDSVVSLVAAAPAALAAVLPEPIAPVFPMPAPAPVETTMATPARVVPTIAVVNQCSVLTEAQIRAGVAAVQVQIDRDFAPAWFVRADLVYVPHGSAPPANTWTVLIMDNSDQAGALGYHDMTSAGVPTAKIFAKTDSDNKLSWSVTLSHEILEMLGDPYIDTTVFVQDGNTTGTIYAYEMCDAVEADALGYAINGVVVSNFILPSYFEASRPANSTKFDFRNVLTAPLSLAAASYCSVFEVRPGTTGWTQQFAQGGPGARFLAKSAAARPYRRIAKAMAKTAR